MSSKVKKLISVLDKKFPFKKAEEWDKVGHFSGDAEKTLTSVVVALDLTKEVMDKAIEAKAEAIIVHHPFMFGDVKAEEFAQFPYKKQLLSRVKNTEINLIVLHTNFDVDKDGMIKTIAKAFGKPIMGSSKYGFMVDKEFKFSELQNILKTQLKTPVIAKRLTNERQVFKKVAFLPGSGDVKDILLMAQDGADLIVTSDIKWSTWVLAQEQEINLVQVPHSIEQAFIKNIASLVKKEFKDTKVLEIYPTIF